MLDDFGPVIDTTVDPLKVYAQTELTNYCGSVEIDQYADPLNWWNKHQHLYPVISILAGKYLAIAATSAPCERLFSDGGNVVTEKRNKLHSETIRSLMFLHNNSDLL